MSPQALGIGLGIPFLGRGGGGAALVNAVRFDGASVWLNKAAAPTGVTDSANGTLSFGVRFEAGDGTAQTILCVGTFSTVESDLGLLVERTAANLIRAVGYTAAGVKIFDCISTGTTVTADATKHNVHIQWNDTACTITIDGADATSNTPGTSGSVDLTNVWQIGRHDDSANRNYLNASLGEFWFDDISLTVNSRFWDSGNSLFRNLASDGSDASGVQPPVYLANVAASFGTNLGSGGNFSANGPLADATNFGAPADQAFALATLWPSSGSEGFARSGTDTGVSDGAFMSFSFWIYRGTTFASKYIFAAINGPANSIIFLTNSTDKWRVFCQNPSNSTVCDWISAAAQMPVDTTFRHYAGWVDVDSGTAKFFRNGVEDTTAPVTLLSSETINFTTLGSGVGNHAVLNTSNMWIDGGISELAVWPRKIDWGVAANLALVYNGGNVVPLPDDGDIDGGGAASWVFNKATAYGHTNGGDADDWAAASSGLVDVQGPALAA